jgi:threonine synthase
MLQILRQSGGTAQAVSEDEIVAAQHRLARIEGIWTAPESAAALAALIRLRASGEVGSRERVVIMLTGCGFKYPAPPLPAPVHLEGSDAAIIEAVRRAIGA